MKKITCCTYEGCFAMAENPDAENPLCATHARQMRKAARFTPAKVKKEINKQSNKLADIMAKYNKRRDVFLRNKWCVVYPDQRATQVHHMMGKIGFADEWARENNISLWLDERFWLPVSMEGHNWIENHPNEAKEKKYSLNRLENYDQVQSRLEDSANKFLAAGPEEPTGD
jgi:hypothetical protein